jgi:hypothetical protein
MILLGIVLTLNRFLLSVYANYILVQTEVVLVLMITAMECSLARMMDVTAHDTHVSDKFVI